MERLVHADLVAAVAGDSGVKPRYAMEDGIPLLLPPELLAAATAAGSDQHDSARGTGQTA